MPEEKGRAAVGRRAAPFAEHSRGRSRSRLGRRRCRRRPSAWRAGGLPLWQLVSDGLQPRALEDLGEAGPLGRDWAQHGLQHLRRLGREAEMCADRAEAVLLHPGKAGAAGGEGDLEGQGAREHRVEDDAERPNVRGGRVVPDALGGEEQLRRGVHDRAAFGVIEEVPAVAVVNLREERGQPEVGDLDLVEARAAQQDVLRLEVAVEDGARVAVVHSRDHLPKVAARHLLLHLARLGDPVEQLAAAAQLLRCTARQRR